MPVISLFISGRAGEVESLDLRSSRALIFSNISVGTGSVLIRCRPEDMWCDAALRIMARKIFSPLLSFEMFGVRDFKVSFDSWITATINLCRSKYSPSSTCLLPMPFALNYRIVKGSPSKALVVIGDGSGFGIGGVGGELQELHAHFLVRRYSAAFWRLEHFEWTQPEQRLHI